VLITEGQGVFESKKTGLKTINSGDGILLFPGEWHRYKPDIQTGWSENWVGFTGQIPDIVLSDSFFPRSQNIVPNCASLLVQNLFATLFHLVSEEPFGFQRTASGVCLQLLAEIYNIQNASESSKLASSLITKAKHLMHKKIEENIDFQLFAKNNEISYSKFRSDFKNQTGFAPQNYFLLMKIEKAKDLLKTTGLQTKQIAFCLGFKSDHYFCRFFKQKTGFSPTQFRSKHKIQMNL
jgi:AraC-like DNA-binding protein